MIEDDDENDLADLFPGFAAETVHANGTRLFLRTGGEGPPLLLLHGFPQTHVMWHRVAPALAERHRVIIPDLRGYGWSDIPRSDPAHRAYSKREMGRDMVALMEALGHVRFALVGHDRGARVGYRMALDAPGRIERLAVLDIVPTHAMWSDFTVKLAMRTYHWLFLAQPAPLPEMLLERAPTKFLHHTLASWTATGTLEAFDPRALDHYRAAFAVPERIHALCEDYRAGQGCDFEDDAADLAAGRRIACPVLALWGEAGIPSETDSPLLTWQLWADRVEGAAVQSGHFLCEENPQATLAALLPFLAGRPA